MAKADQRVAEYIARHALISDSCHRVIVGLSGGADSVALLLILKNLGYKLLAAHCNYHLREAESDRDTAFTTDLCAEQDIELRVKHFRVEPQQHESVEMACRRLRYEWFDELRSSIPGSIIAVAHHIDDNIETLLLNLLRGTGITGMHGMLPRNGEGIIRPLLCLTRNDIEEYLQNEGQIFVVDSTNLTDRYRRNKLRRNVLPAIERHFPDYRQRIDTSIRHLTDDWTLLSELSERAIAPYITTEGDIHLRKLIAAEGKIAEPLLYRLLRSNGFTRSQVADITSASDASGRTFTSTSGITLYLNRGILATAPEGDPMHISTSIISPKDVIPDRTARTVYFDADMLGIDYTFRHWQEGDRMQPFGMKGRSKKLSDIFNDSKIPLAMKRAIPVMVSGDTILWVAGVRASCHYPVTSATRRVLRVSVDIF